MRPMNTLVIVSDEHNRDVLGCYGEPLVHTPVFDALAARGTLFSNAYCNAPVCVPSRASMATGLFPHQIGAWDSTSPYTGEPKGWAHGLRASGHDVVSIGKLHYRNAADDCGFDPSLAPMHVHNGIGWMSSLLRDPPAPITGADLMAKRIGAGETDYTHYDRDIVQQACNWLRERAEQSHDLPWVLHIGLVAPHFPLIAPQEFYELYDGVTLPRPRQYDQAERPRHPVLDAMRRSSNYDDWFDEDAVRMARQAYFGLVSFLDHNVGRILAALETTGQLETTRIIYTSDHGDNLGHRGLWGKSVMYDDAAAVPLIIAGPDVPQGLQVDTPVSLVDLHPTIIESAGSDTRNKITHRPGQSLTARFAAPEADRSVFSEYHDWSSISGMFMLRTLRWKIIRYPGYDDQLFDMQSDPHETEDLAGQARYAATLNEMRALLASYADIDKINAAAFKDQKSKIDAFGGVEAILRSEELGYTPAPATTERPDGELPADPFEP
jgi:choline-sulfatase